MINNRLPLRGRLILFITRTITERIGLHSVLLPLRIGLHSVLLPLRIGLHSVLLPLSVTLAPDVRSRNTKDKVTVPLAIARFDRKERKKERKKKTSDTDPG